MPLPRGISTGQTIRTHDRPGRPAGAGRRVGRVGSISNSAISKNLPIVFFASHLLFRVIAIYSQSILGYSHILAPR